MRFAHLRTRRRLALLAAGALDGEEREQALGHVADCESCRGELSSLRAFVAELALDPARSAALPVSVATLARRTLARLDGAGREAAPARALPLLPAAAAAALVLALLAAALLDSPRLPSAVPARLPAAVSIDDEALRRLERRVVREQAARYLSEAGDVLVTVAAAPQLCDRRRETADLAEETRRSRELLTRRALLVDLEGDAVRAARPVLEDVERVLREVARLDPCARPEQLEAIHAELRGRRLLLRIGLLARELQG